MPAMRCVKVLQQRSNMNTFIMEHQLGNYRNCLTGLLIEKGQ